MKWLKNLFRKGALHNAVRAADETEVHAIGLGNAMFADGACSGRQETTLLSGAVIWGEPKSVQEGGSVTLVTRFLEYQQGAWLYVMHARDIRLRDVTLTMTATNADGRVETGVCKLDGWTPGVPAQVYVPMSRIKKYRLHINAEGFDKTYIVE